MGSSDESILRAYGGINCNSLNHILQLDNEDIGDDAIYSHMMKTSSFYDTEEFNNFVKNNKNKFTILSTNIESVHAKFDDLAIFVEQLRDLSFEFGAICLQECWLSETQELSHLYIEGYSCISQIGNIGRKGGLMIFLHNDYSYDVLVDVKDSTIWEGQVIEIKSKNLKKNIILSNIYRPPRNSNENISSFIDELRSIILSIDKRNLDIIIAGDFNINLLKLNDRELYNEYFDMLTSLSYFPKITLPTRLSGNCGTLIDNFFCRISQSTLNASSGILIKQFSDHQPYFIFLDIDTHHAKPPRYVQIQTESPKALDDFYKEIAESDIFSKLNTNKLSDPNINYNTMHKIIDDARKKHIPNKIMKFNRYRHKKSKWITNGILISIRYRDKLYKKLHSITRDSPLYDNYKINLGTYNRILKQSIQSAKKSYYTSCFTKYKNDIKNTWVTINGIINKSTKSHSIPDFFIHNNEIITDKQIIANRFNSFFTNIGPELAQNIEDNSSKHFSDFLIDKPDCTFNFQEVDENTIVKIIDKFPCKTSSGPDSISMKLVKYMKNLIALPISVMVNQMLTTGIFPDRLKLAKVKPIFKKDDKNSFTNYRPISLLPSISKNFEKVIYDQLYAYFQSNNLFFPQPIWI